MYRLLFSLLGATSFLGATAFGAAVPPSEILEKTDSIRNPDEAFSMTVKVESKDDTREFEVLTKGGDRTVIRTKAPTRDKGRDLLMVDENMWAYIPTLKRAMRVSLSQKISGEAANGDISRMRWAKDYEGAVEKETDTEYQLLLTARKKGLTYEKIRAFVDKKTFRPLRAEYLTAAGKPLKKATFSEYKELAGKTRPSLITIEDAVRTDKKSKITIESMKIETIADSTFSTERFGAR